ncbi:MAG TPA: hypothetical protein VF062_05690 [Candidatus Limnocylindrales bacterium]
MTAVAAGLLTQGPSDEITVGAAVSLGAILLVFGVSIFTRQVAFTAYSRRLTSASNAIRFYLAQRAPGLRQYLFLPVGADRGAFPARPTRQVRNRGGIAAPQTRPAMPHQAPVGGFAGAIGLLNSAILGLVALLVSRSGWGVATAIALFAVSFGAHFAYIQRSRLASAAYLANLERERGIGD